MLYFSTDLFEQNLDFATLDSAVHISIKEAAQSPNALYLFFHRYTYFNGYASAMISRLANSIGLSRYLFLQPDTAVLEESDRGMEIAAKILTAAADEGTYENPSHRALAQLTLKTVGDYANLSAAQRNQIAAPIWLEQLVQSLIAGYQGTSGSIESLVRGMGFHLASEILGDREYALIDQVIRYEFAGTRFDRYLQQAASGNIDGHKFHPWCWIVIHSRYQGAGVEVEHSNYALAALNLVAQCRPEPKQQIAEWALQGFDEFVSLQQRLFQEIHRECFELRQCYEAKATVSI
ncbi:MAG: hypothetical protein HC886_12475 [Leptolyngbyaceae cyanobacterium SM1_1_3]|nr:hypothetical protein [Leptolyngbyaceae cyanobacterium SM1_1_3]NJN03337.1 hypothetical protein [Leptolyngbyaceae cyanobacterium RM1_1_2]NJO11305.1 hypothetical protein [Leptolyngbyaceae cyanobacterium SL_1_1]